MWLILQCSSPDNYIIYTGQTVALQYFIECAFNNFALGWRAHVSFNNDLNRPTDLVISKGDPSKAKNILGWSSTVKVEQVIALMCQ